MIYHVTKKSAWETALQTGAYEAPSLHIEGFIHNSTAAQLEGVLTRYYADQKDLLLLHINEDKLIAQLKYELAPSVNEMFPHIFGAINLDAVEKVEPIQSTD